MVGFDHDNIEAAKAYQKIEDNYKTLTEEQRSSQRLDYTEKHLINSLMGLNLIGTFSSLEKAQEMIQKYPDTVINQQYEIILIEKHLLDEIDGLCFGYADLEAWYEVERIFGEDGYIKSHNILPIDRPNYYRGTIGFA